MKKLILIGLLLILVASLFAQKQTGRVTYFFNRDAKISLGNNMPTEQQKALTEMLKKQFQKTFVLEFSDSKSIYYQKKELQENTKSNINIMIFDGTAGKLYKSTSEKEYLKTDESLGKRFLISDKLLKPNWELIDSTKKVLNYMCYKAKYTKEEADENDSLIKTTVEVWYAPDIPTNTGPDKLWGLPGLILEVHEGKVSIRATKVEINADNIAIEKPKKGKKISQDEFDEIHKKHMKKVKEMYEGGRQKDDGNTIRIKISG